MRLPHPQLRRQRTDDVCEAQPARHHFGAGGKQVCVDDDVLQQQGLMDVLIDCFLIVGFG